MKSWSGLSLAGMISAATIQLAAAAPPDAASGYAEIAAPADAEMVAIVPRPDAHRTTMSYAIETAPERAEQRSNTQHAPQVLASLPAGPPVVVEIRFDPRRADNPGRAGQIATALGREGITVRVIGPAAFPVSDGVGFIFAEDAAAATEITRYLAGSLAHATQSRPDARHMGDTAPGTIEITLGNDRGTS